MTRPATGNDQHSCVAGCSGCGPDSESISPDALPAGWATSTASMAAFLLPLILAILGVVVLSQFWEGVGAQVVGAAAGLLVGVAAAMFLVRTIVAVGRNDKDNEHDTD